MQCITQLPKKQKTVTFAKTSQSHVHFTLVSKHKIRKRKTFKNYHKHTHKNTIKESYKQSSFL